MSYDPRVYEPTSTKTLFTTIDSTTNADITTGDKIQISSAGFSHDNCSVNASGQLVFTGGEHIICATIENTRRSLSGVQETPVEFRFYDITNAQFIGVAGRCISQLFSSTNALQAAPMCIAYVSSAITVEIRCQSKTGGIADCYNRLALNYIGNPWGYIYSATGV